MPAIRERYLVMSSSLLQLVLRHGEKIAGPAEADCELVHRFADAHDEAAFSELLRRHGPMVWAVCRQSLVDPADAEDAFQATFLALIRSAPSVRRGEAIAGWLHGVAVRVTLKLKRSAARRRQHEERTARGESDHPVAEGRWDALLAAVHEEVHRLPDSMRTAFVLCELEGMRQPEVAEQLGWKPGTLTSRLTRARQLLIQRLSRRGLTPAVAGGSLGLGMATASAAVPHGLIEKVLSLTIAGETVSPALLKLVCEGTPMLEIRTKLAAAILAAAAGIGIAFYPAAGAQPREAKNSPPPSPTAAAVAEAAPGLPAALQYVPPDAVLFVHVDAAKLWNGSLGKSLRKADAATFDEMTAFAKKKFGAAPDALQSATLFLPTIKAGDPAIGLVLEFKAPYDKAKLKAGLEAMAPPGSKPTVLSPSDRIAILIVDLDEKEYGKPQPADKKGPLTEAIHEAGSGKHLLVIGSAPANLPEELRSDDFPPLKPLLQADSIVGIVDLKQDLSVEIRVNAATPRLAGEAEKGLSLLANLAREGLGGGLTDVGKETDNDPAMKDVVTLLKGLQAGLKDARFATEGNTARATVKVPADLPFGSAFFVGKRKAGNAAARNQSANNLKQIGLAMHNYASAMGSLPPAAVCDKTGKPMLSWRVLILPYIEQQELYKEFKLDEPWDSEHNKKLLSKMPEIYKLPGVPDAKPNETHYRVFVGNDAMFEYLKGPKLVDILDGTSNTILTVTAKDAVPWTKPDELAFDPDKDMTKLFGFFSGDVCMVGMGDGAVRGLSKSISKKALNAWITKSGGEVIRGDE